MTGAIEDVQATLCATLVDEWIALGLRRAMVAPGSRSTPLALALVDRSDLDVHVFHDERSAGFAALGAGLADGVPSLVVCTSGTAATHFHAAVVEAHHAAVPMLVATADRPAELHGVGAPQTIDQRHLYGAAVRGFFDVPPASELAPASWREVARAAWFVASGSQRGPVHLNLAFREPLVGAAEALPPSIPARLHEPSGVDAADVELVASLLVGQRGVIIAGHGVDDPGAVERLAAATGWPILADARSGCRAGHHAVCAADGILREPEFAAAHAPHCVLQLGMPPASKVLGQWVAASPDVAVVAVSPDGLVSDPWSVGSRQVHAPIGMLCDALVGPLGGRAVGTPWLARWRHAERAAQAAIAQRLDAQATLSEIAVARRVSALDPSVHVVVSSSMPIRDIEWFGVPGQGPVVHANRGTNGIDGVVATAIGVATTGVRTVVLIGDVACCHDASSFTALARRDVDLAIVVVDNDGGGIFSFLPQARSVDGDRFETLFGTPHGTDLVALAGAHRIAAATATTATELDEVLSGRGVRLVRVPSERAANEAAHRAMNAAIAAAVRR